MKSKIFKVLYICLVVTVFTSCTEDDINDNEPCGPSVVLNSELYGEDPSSEFGIINAVITGDCLRVELGASGCDGDTWVANLYSTQTVTGESDVMARVDLVNNEECLAVIGKEFYFDLTMLQVADYNSITIHLDGLETNLVYEY